MLRTAGILETSGVSFTTFPFFGDAFRWWEAYERCRPVSATPLTWKQLSGLFLEKFVPQFRREELCRQFEQLRQGDMSVTQYEMRFSELACHAIWLIPTDRERIRRFIDGLTFQLRLLMSRERVSGATFDEVVDIAHQIEMVHSQERVEMRANRPHGSGDFNGVHSGSQFYRGRGRSFGHAQVTRPAHRGALASHGSYSAHSGQSSSSALPAQSSHHASSAHVSTGNVSGYQEQQFR
ncbi:uncharacterized protein [Nicotiana tomentosiformis]|uniref:uncharacterized protein n=1 Tax=Nicotiana tomentosiformis TaxID=4098 RepID=UPI00388CE639